MVRIGQIILGEQGTKICVPIVGITEKEILDATTVACNSECDVVELRIDYFERAHSVEAILELLMLIKPKLKGRGLLFTWRTKGEGGERSISSDDYFIMLEQLIPTGLVDAIDIELLFDQERMLKTIEFAKVHGVTIIMSNHDFNGTPSRETIVNRLIQMKELLADVPKIAVMPHTTGDVLTLLEATAEVKALYPSDPIITMAMGPLGAITRASGALFGNAMTFASAGKASAPGQIDVHELKRILDIIDVDGVFDEQQHKREKIH
ncbi:type I 3-dehydroquinate dehydratase [Veillonella tobetsuensis]